MTRSGKKSTRQAAPRHAGLLELGMRILERLLPHLEDFAILLLGALAMMTLLGLLGLTHGAMIDPIIGFLRRWLGWGALVIPLTLGYFALQLLQRRMGKVAPIRWMRLIALEAATIGLLGLFSVLDGVSLARAELGGGGGLIGWSIAILLGEWFGPWGRAIVLSALAALALVYGTQDLILWLAERLERRRSVEAPQDDFDLGENLLELAGDPAQPPVRTPKPAVQIPKEFRKNFTVQEVPAEEVRPVERDERLPPLELLEDKDWTRSSSKEINRIAGLIEKTLHDFGLPAKVVDFRTGPSVTQFAVEPGYLEAKPGNGEGKRQKVRVSQISALSNDLALALSAARLRIEAPVPGKSYLGIEVPNRSKEVVRLRPILVSRAYQKAASALKIALGRDVSGGAVVADLAKMPHLLIAGTTGSGKSVCISSITCSLITNNTPEDLRLVMIDPKMVELVRFNGLPHLLGKVETEQQRILGVMQWCTTEMDRRYRLLEEARARDIETYNRQLSRRQQAEKMPRLVVMIDELSDLMMSNPDQTEKTLVRLAQMARATGIHLIVATQRPSTDVVTGLIKANFPARIAFAVASGIDSRVILDTGGAEALLGAGDMLYLSPEAGAPLRLQGVYLSDLEIERLVEFWVRSNAEQEGGAARAPWEGLISRQAALIDKDDVLEQAIALVRQTRQASASMLQRKLNVGYPRAARLMDELEELGVIGGPETGGRTRSVLIAPDVDPLDPELDD